MGVAQQWSDGKGGILVKIKTIVLKASATSGSRLSILHCGDSFRNKSPITKFRNLTSIA